MLLRSVWDCKKSEVFRPPIIKLVGQMGQVFLMHESSMYVCAIASQPLELPFINPPILSYLHLAPLLYLVPVSFPVIRS